MTDLRELYQEVILDHSRQPRNFRELGDDAHKADGYNPLCGDRVTVFVELDGGKVVDVSFKGSGCAISTASASLMTEALKGKTLEEAQALFEAFHKLVTGEPGGEDVGKLAALEGVRDFPVRVKCATLPWHTLRAAMEGSHKPVTTE